MILASMFLMSTAFAQTYLIEESFETFPVPGWTPGSPAPTQGTGGQTGSYSLLFSQNSSLVYIVTTSITDPDRLTFYHKKSHSNTNAIFDVYYSSSSSGPWTGLVNVIPSDNRNYVLSATELSLPSGTYYFKLENNGIKKDVYIDDFYVTQSIVPSTTSLSDFVYEPSNGPSPERSFTVSGADLTANIVLTAPTNYEISKSSGSGFTSDTLIFTQYGGSVSSKTVYVRLISGLDPGTYNSEDITISSTDKISKTVSCSGDVRQAINPSVETLSNFNYDPGSGPSSEQSFTVSGQDLTANISITPPTNYEISTGTGVAFTPTDPITLTQSGGLVSSTTIYVRLKSGLSSGSYSPENITLSSTDKISRTVACNGFVGPMVLNVKVFLEGGLW